MIPHDVFIFVHIYIYSTYIGMDTYQELLKNQAARPGMYGASVCVSEWVCQASWGDSYH